MFPPPFLSIESRPAPNDDNDKLANSLNGCFLGWIIVPNYKFSWFTTTLLPILTKIQPNDFRSEWDCAKTIGLYATAHEINIQRFPSKSNHRR
jgi:hypothetical protein